MSPHPDLRARLEALYAATDHRARIAADPVEFPRRYAEPRDAEIAGLLAAGLAYGRVSLFKPVIAQILARADAMGGPRAWVEGFDPKREASHLEPIRYRWNSGDDISALIVALRGLFETRDDLGALFAAHWDPSHDTIRPALTGAVAELRALAGPAGGLSRGLRYLLVSPEGGSACKRWNLYLRWMIRSDREGVDLGLWSIPARALVLPLDTHTGRLARFLGLTSRADGSWRTAEAITAALRRFDPVDPVRYDFALAHLGISGACLGHRDPEICPACPLDAVCAAR